MRKHLQPFAKAFSWRVIGIVDTMVLAYFVTGSIETGLGIAGIGTVTHTVLYVLHEKAWAHDKIARVFGTQNGGH